MSQQQWKSDKESRVVTSEACATNEACRPQSASRSRSRRSWFGARPETEDRLQALPRMPAPTVPWQSRKRSSRTKRQFFWSSSNPDGSDDDIPSVPSLSRGESLDSISTQADFQQASSAIAPRRKYVPRSAAKSFLATTSAASEDKMKSYRQSFKLDDRSDLVCSTEEQQVEWAKLMNAQAAAATTQVPSDRVDSPVEVQAKYVNTQALAALEFGQLR